MEHLVSHSVRRGAKVRGLDDGSLLARFTWLIYIGLILNFGMSGRCAVITGNELQGTHVNRQLAPKGESLLTVAQNHFERSNTDVEFDGNDMNSGWASDDDDDDASEQVYDEEEDDDGDTIIETESNKMMTARHVPVILLPEFAKQNNNYGNHNKSTNEHQPVVFVTVEYEPDFVIRCAAKGMLLFVIIRMTTFPYKQAKDKILTYLKVIQGQIRLGNMKVAACPIL